MKPSSQPLYAEVERATAVTEAGNAVERAYREHHAKLWRALLLFCADPEIASDAVAEAFSQALRRGDAIRDPSRWVWRAAFRLARGELQRRGRTTTLVELPVEMPEPTVDLVRALGRLSAKQRAAVVLHHYAGYSTKETATIIGSTAPAVGVHLQRARTRLRELLEEHDDA
jgi:RNA polymerase sigma-70 factor (ECF subfamily)